MSIPEAAELVIQASSMSLSNCDLFILDMGKPIRITELVKSMIILAGKSIKNKDNLSGDIEIIYSGLRPGEKLYEELIIDGFLDKTVHPLIYRCNESRSDINKINHIVDSIIKAGENCDDEEIKKILIEAPLNYKTFEN